MANAMDHTDEITLNRWCNKNYSIHNAELLSIHNCLNCFEPPFATATNNPLIQAINRTFQMEQIIHTQKKRKKNKINQVFKTRLCIII